MNCNCQVCKEHRFFKTFGLPDALIDRLQQDATELAFMRAVIAGKWPNAVEVLTEALAKAKALREEDLLKTPTYH